MYTEDEYLMLSGIQHFTFCRRQWALIHVEQQWVDNYRTSAGEIFHQRVHNEELMERRGTIITARGLKISSSLLGVSGQCDVVEFHQTEQGINLAKYTGQWKVLPIEYKRGLPKDGHEDELQLCAQAMCLEEMFITEISEGFLFYGENHRRKEVTFSTELRNLVIQYCQEMHQYFKRGYTPQVKTSAKCRACSLNDICLPKLQKAPNVSTYLQQAFVEGTDK